MTDLCRDEVNDLALSVWHSGYCHYEELKQNFIRNPNKDSFMLIKTHIRMLENLIEAKNINIKYANWDMLDRYVQGLCVKYVNVYFSALNNCQQLAINGYELALKKNEYRKILPEPRESRKSSQW